MNLKTILASADTISLVLDAPVPAGASVKVYVFSPAVAEEQPPIGILSDAHVEHDTVTVSRRACSQDGLTFCYAVELDGELLNGVKYVETITAPARDFPFPVADSKKGLQVSDPEDAKKLGVKHTAININEGDMLMLAPEEGHTIPFDYDGVTYYFRKDSVDFYDETFKAFYDMGVSVTMILLNSRHWRINVPEDLWAIIKHPHYEDEGRISAFNMETEDGVRFYRAFIAFLADRYTRPDGRYGQALGMIISNEVDAQWIWGNAGDMPMDAYMDEYTTAMRLAWQVAADTYASMRIYISLDHFWAQCMDPKQPNRFYPSRDMLLYMAHLSEDEGQFPWCIAHHPYPEDLHFPDFWNDKTATDDDNTIRVTFKNLQVLARFIHRPDMLCHGEPRRIILSEQGFNSHWTEASEILQAAAYGHAYRKVMEIPEIDSFILHAHRDNMYEFGLSLGLWRRKRDSNELDAPKPIYAVFQAIDQLDEKGVYHWERY